MIEKEDYTSEEDVKRIAGETLSTGDCHPNQCQLYIREDGEQYCYWCGQKQ